MFLIEISLYYFLYFLFSLWHLPAILLWMTSHAPYFQVGSLFSLIITIIYIYVYVYAYIYILDKLF